MFHTNSPQASSRWDMDPTLRTFFFANPQTFFNTLIAKSMKTLFDYPCMLDIPKANWTVKLRPQYLKKNRGEWKNMQYYLVHVYKQHYDANIHYRHIHTLRFILILAVGSTFSLRGSRCMSKSVNPGTSTYSCHFDTGLNITGTCVSFAAFAADAACGLPLVVEGRLLIVQLDIIYIVHILCCAKLFWSLLYDML